MIRSCKGLKSWLTPSDGMVELCAIFAAAVLNMAVRNEGASLSWTMMLCLTRSSQYKLAWEHGTREFDGCHRHRVRTRKKGLRVHVDSWSVLPNRSNFSVTGSVTVFHTEM